MRHVEFLGIPGSGKSTVATAAVEALPDAIDLEQAVLIAIRANGEDQLTRLAARMTRSSENRVWRWAYGRSPDRFSALTRFIATTPGLIETVARAQSARSRRDLGQEQVLGWVLNLMARFQLAREFGDQVGNLVIDEGFCQRAVALFGYGFDDEDQGLLHDYLEHIPPPDVVIVVETPLEICESRIGRRGWSQRVHDLDSKGRHQFIVSSAAVVDAVLNHLSSSGVPLIRVDGTRSVADSVLEIGGNFSGS